MDISVPTITALLFFFVTLTQPMSKAMNEEVIHLLYSRDLLPLTESLCC